MKVLLPPSETKRDGGKDMALSLPALSFPSLTPLRDQLINSLERLSQSVERSAKWLEIGGVLAEIEAGKNADIRTSPTLPAVERYTGVLYDAFAVESMDTKTRKRTSERVLIASALFGLLNASDYIPTYRLSGGNRLPRLGGLAPRWRPLLRPLLSDIASQELVVDLRSAAYVALAPKLDLVTVNVLNERPDGSRRVVSHANKHTKGLLARCLVESPAELQSAADVVEVAQQNGLRAELNLPNHVDIIVTD